MKCGAKLLGYPWNEAFNFANYFINRGPTKANGGVTP
jgi:hypothetical protein